MNGCLVPCRFFESTRECIQHHPITKEKHNQIKMETKTEKKQEMAARGEHGPVLLASQTNSEIRFQNGI